MKKKISIVSAIILMALLLTFLLPNYSYGFEIDGGKLLSPVMSLLTAICDGVNDIIQKVVLGADGDALWNINRGGDILSAILGWIAVIVVVALSVTAAVLLSPATAVGTLIAVGVKAAIMSVGKAVIAYFLVSFISSQMLPGNVYLPFIEVTPDNILQNKIELFDIDFFSQDAPEEKLNGYGGTKIKDEKLVSSPYSGELVLTEINDINNFVTEEMMNYGYSGDIVNLFEYLGKKEWVKIAEWEKDGQKYSAKVKLPEDADYEYDIKAYEVFLQIYSVGESTAVEAIKSTATVLKDTIAKWYVTIRTFVIIGFLLVLVYAGIRTLTSTIASDKSKYKKMLLDWLVSFCLLFVIHYIMIFSMQLVNLFTEMLSSATIEKSGVEYFEIQDDKVYDYVEKNLNELNDKIEFTKSNEKPTNIENGEAYSTLFYKDGKKTVRFPVDNFTNQARLKMQFLDENGKTTAESIGWSIIYIMLTLFTVTYSFIYLKRVIYIGFLILVAPVVVLTYSIDRFNDGQAQGFNTWLKEYLFNLAIQPFHLLLYIVFVNMAMDLASSNPIYVLVILGFMTQAEKMLRKMFGFEKAQTPGVLSGAVGAGLAMSGMQKLLNRKPHHSDVEKNLNKLQKGQDGADSRIREQNVDNIIGDGEEPQTTLAYANAAREMQNREMTRRLSLSSVSSAMQQARRQVKKPKIKFNMRKGLKEAARHYVQTKGRKIADRVNNTSLLKSGARVLAGGAAALTAGTAGVLLGAVEGSPEKAFRNAGLAGGLAYKGVSSRINTQKDKELKESFEKAGYGADYKQYQQEILANEIKHNLDNRTTLEQKLDWDSDQIKDFFENTMDEYISEGVKTIDDMIIGEKLKLDKVVSTTSQAISVMSLGQRIGNSKDLTSKKREEWAQTIIDQSPRMAEMQRKVNDMKKQYASEIAKINKMQIEETEKATRIAAVKAKQESDRDLAELTGKIKKVQDQTMAKIDKYSEYKYKG